MYLQFIFDTSKSFLSMDGDGRIFSGPLIWLGNCWLWLLLFIPLLCGLSPIWWFNFSFDGTGVDVNFELDNDEFISPAIFGFSLPSPELICIGVFELDRECECWPSAVAGLLKLSHCRSRLLPGGDPDCSFLGVLGRVSAKACVCNGKMKLNKKLMKIVTIYKMMQINRY